MFIGTWLCNRRKKRANIEPLWTSNTYSVLNIPCWTRVRSGNLPAWLELFHWFTGRRDKKCFACQLRFISSQVLQKSFQLRRWFLDTEDSSWLRTCRSCAGGFRQVGEAFGFFFSEIAAGNCWSKMAVRERRHVCYCGRVHAKTLCNLASVWPAWSLWPIRWWSLGRLLLTGFSQICHSQLRVRCIPVFKMLSHLSAAMISRFEMTKRLVKELRTQKFCMKC